MSDLIHVFIAREGTLHTETVTPEALEAVGTTKLAFIHPELFGEAG